MRCDLANMLRQCRNAIDPKQDRYGYAAALEDLEGHIRGVRDGTHTLDEFADFYMIRPVLNAAVPPAVASTNQPGSPSDDRGVKGGKVTN